MLVGKVLGCDGVRMRAVRRPRCRWWWSSSSGHGKSALRQPLLGLSKVRLRLPTTAADVRSPRTVKGDEHVRLSLSWRRGVKVGYDSLVGVVEGTSSLGMVLGDMLERRGRGRLGLDVLPLRQSMLLLLLLLRFIEARLVGVSLVERPSRARAVRARRVSRRRVAGRLCRTRSRLTTVPGSIASS